MKMTNEECLGAISAFNDFLVDHKRQAQMILNGKHGDEVIEIIGQLTQASATTILKSMRGGHEANREKDGENAGKIVSSAEQLSRMSHRLGQIYGEFWAEQGMSLYKIFADMDFEAMMRMIAAIKRDDDGNVIVEPLEGYSEVELENSDVKAEIEQTVEVFKGMTDTEPRGAIIARPAKPLVELISIIEGMKGKGASFEEHQLACEIPPFADNQARRLGFMIVTYLISTITGGIADEERVSFNTISTMAFVRAVTNTQLAGLTPLPMVVDFKEMFQAVNNDAYQDFCTTFDIRGNAAAIREALEKVKKGEMTKEEMEALYKNLRDNPPVSKEEEGKFIFSAPASVQ